MYDLNGDQGTFTVSENEFIKIAGDLVILKKKPEEINKFNVTITSFDGEESINQEFIFYIQKDKQILTTQNKTSEQVVLYPNPAQNYIQINGVDNIEHTIIYDMNGKVVATLKNASSEVNIANLSNGTYILKIVSNGQTILKSFIKE